MPTPHPHLELAHRIMPLAAYIREHDLGDDQLSQAAVRGLAEYVGLDVVFVDPDPMDRCKDLGRALLLQFQDMLNHRETRSEALQVGLAFTDLVVKTLRESIGERGRRRHRQQVRRLQVGGH